MPENLIDIFSPTNGDIIRTEIMCRERNIYLTPEQKNIISTIYGKLYRRTISSEQCSLLLQEKLGISVDEADKMSIDPRRSK